MTVEVIAEIGSNWQGDMAVLDELAWRCASAGADTVKVQHYPAELGPHPFTVAKLGAAQTIVKAHGLRFLASVFDQRTLDEYVQVCAPTRVKIASPELVRDDLLEQLGGHDVILSTGMSTLEQVDHAMDVLSGPHEVALLHCVSAYPAPVEHMHLRALGLLRTRYGCPVGLSDHTLDPVTAPVAAVALGATIVEKHVTLDRKAEGPDHVYAIEPADLTRMVLCLRMAAKMVGEPVKQVQPSEDPFDRRPSAA